MINIVELSNLEGKVYVYVPTKEIEQKFLVAAEEQGFTFGNGEKPTTSSGEDLYLIYSDQELSNVGIVGHLAFQSKDVTCSEKRHYINYEKYILGAADYDDLRNEEAIKVGTTSVL